jgi:hypothetical protein
MRARRRDLTAKTVKSIGKFYFRSSITGERASNVSASELTGPGFKEVTLDELHSGPPYTSGGPFFRARLDTLDAVAGSCQIQGVQQASGAGLNALLKEIGRPLKPGETWRRGYEGGVVVRPPVRFTVPSVEGADDYKPGINPNDLEALGSRAYNKLRPKPEKLNLFQSLYEIREIPRMIRPLAANHAGNWERIRRDFRGLRDLSSNWRGESAQRLTERMNPKRAADKFLEVQFGWKPFVGDVVSLIDTTLHYDQYLADTIRKNGSWQHRKFSEDELMSSNLVHESTSSGLSVSSYSSPSFGPTYLTNSSLRVYKETYTRIWYEGKFRYYYPEFNKIPPSQLGALVMLQRKLRLHGLFISPTLIYRVIPWTWLVDWFVNIGDNLQMLEDQLTGRVASLYMYLMRHTVERYRYVLTWNTVDGQSLSFEKFDSIDCKRRVPAGSNFSFSAAPGGLSPTQQAILIALGLSQ